MKILKLFVLLAIPYSILLASGGSTYSRIGFGEFNYNFSARRAGLGGLGYSIVDKDFLSYTNPAGWNQLESTRFEAGYLVDAGNFSDKSNSAFYSNSYFNGMIFGFPISRDYGVTFTGGIVPYSNVKYDVTENVDSILVSPHTASYSGTGGMSRLFFGTSLRMFNDFSIGAALDYYNGESKNSTTISFSSTSTFKDIENTRDISYHGIGFTAGIISGDLSNLLSINFVKDWRIGISYSSKVDMSADSANVYSTTIGSYNESTGSLKANLPARIGIGTSFKFDKNYLFTLDYMSQSMEDFTWDGKKSISLQNANKLSFGMEYRPDYNENGFWNQTMLRAGISYEKTPYKVSGYSVDQLSLTAGVSLPLSYGNTIDHGFQYSKRGTQDFSLVKENLYRFNVAISIGELWFIQVER